MGFFLLHSNDRLHFVRSKYLSKQQKPEEAAARFCCQLKGTGQDTEAKKKKEKKKDLVSLYGCVLEFVINCTKLINHVYSDDNIIVCPFRGMWWNQVTATHT